MTEQGSIVHEDGHGRSKLWYIIFGERRWSMYAFWGLCVVFLFFFFRSVGADEFFITWENALQLSMLSFACGVLSELRYRLLRDVRSSAVVKTRD